MKIRVPDYDEMIEITTKISELMHERDKIKNQIEFNEGLILRVANLDTKYYINGKPPATNFVEKAYFNSKIDGVVDFPALRESLASVSSELERYKMIFDIMKQQINLFQTESANKRNSTL
jgi:hypothetical protein